MTTWGSFRTNGAFTQQSGTFTLGGDGYFYHAGNITLAGGTFNAPAGTLTVDGPWSNNRTFSIASGATFNHNNGTVVFRGYNTNVDVDTQQTFHNLTMSKETGWALNIASGDTLVVEGTLALNDGVLKTGTVEARSNVTVGSGYDGNFSDASLRFVGPADQSVTISGTPVMTTGTITVDKASGTVTTWGSFRTNGAFTQQSGTFTLGGDGYFYHAGNVTLAGGTFNAPTGTLTVDGPWSNNRTFSIASDATFNHNSGTAVFSGYNTNIDVNTQETFYSLTMNKQHGYALNIASGDTLVVEGTLALNDGAAQTGTIEAQGNVVVGGNYDAGSASTRLGGGVDQVITLTGDKWPTGTFTVDKSSGTASSNGTWTVAGTTTIEEGTLVLGGTTTFNNATTVRDGATLSLAANTIFNSSVTVQGGGTLSGTTAGTTIRLDGGDTLTVQAGGQLTLQGSSGNNIVFTNNTDDGALKHNVILQGSYDIDYVTLRNSNANGGNRIYATNSADGGNTASWDFTGIYTWQGDTSTNWHQNENWNANNVPTPAQVSSYRTVAE